MAENVRGLHVDALGTANIPTAEQLEDYDKDVLTLLPSEADKASLFALSVHKFGKRPVGSSKFEWRDEPMPSITGTITSAATTAGGTSLQLASAAEAGKFPMGSKVYSETHNEHAVVTLNDGTDTLTISKDYDGGGDTQWEIGESVYNIGVAPLEGGGPVAMVAQSSDLRTNYIEYLERTVRLTNRERMEKNQKTGDEYLNRKKINLLRILQDIEMALTFGVASRVFDNATDSYRYTTAGFIAQIPVARRYTNTATPDYGGSGTHVTTTTYKNLIDHIESLYQYGSREKVWFCEPGASSQLSKMAATDAHLQLEIMSPSEIFGKKKGGQAFGFNLRRLVFGGNTAILVPMPLWQEHGLLANKALVIDPKFVRVAHLGTGVLNFELDVVQDGSTKKVDRWGTYFGLELKNLNAHALTHIPDVT